MPRQTSDTFRGAAFAETTGEVLLACLTINEETLSEPLRFVKNTEAITRTIDGQPETFLPFDFEMELPEQRSDAMNTVSIQIDNVDRQIAQAVELAKGIPTATLEVVLASDPDVVEVGPVELEIEMGEYDQFVLTASLVYEDLMAQQSPKHTRSPGYYPGLF